MRKCDIDSRWYADCYKDKADVIPAARSFAYLHEERSRDAVLLIHGYAGYPGELVRPAEDLYDCGFDCFVPRLPGMGTSGEDFIQSRKEDWLSVLRHGIDDLYQEYRQVSIVSHSMGALLGVILSGQFPIAHLVLASPAFSIPSLDARKLSLIAPFRKQLDTEWASDVRYHMHYEGAPKDDAALGREYWSHIYPRQLLEMEELRKQALSIFHSLAQDILILLGGKDTVVDISATEELAKLKRPGSTRLVDIPYGTHFLFYDIDPEAEERAVHEVLSFLISD